MDVDVAMSQDSLHPASCHRAFGTVMLTRTNHREAVKTLCATCCFNHEATIGMHDDCKTVDIQGFRDLESWLVLAE